MGRFDRKYSDATLAELYRLTIDASPPLTVPAALEVLAETTDKRPGVEVRAQTAYRYIRDERERRGLRKRHHAGESPSQLRERLIAVCAREVGRIERGAKGNKGSTNPARIKELAGAIAEIEKGERAAAARIGRGVDRGEIKGDNGAAERTGPATARLLERVRSEPSQSPESLQASGIEQGRALSSSEN